MSLDKINMEVSIERSKDHACTGFVLYCKDTERSIASFWSESDAEKAEDAINSYDANQAIISKQAEQIKSYKNQIAKIIMLHKQSGLSGDTSVDALFELADFIELLEVTKEQS